MEKYNQEDHSGQTISTRIVRNSPPKWPRTMDTSQLNHNLGNNVCCGKGQIHPIIEGLLKIRRDRFPTS